MKTLKLLLPILFFLVFISCKKKETTTEPTPTPTTPDNGYYGVLASTKFCVLNSFTTNTTEAFFSNTSITLDYAIFGGISYGTISAGTISLNSLPLTLINPTTIPSYYDPTSTDFSPNYNWIVSGANGIPAINYTYSVATPAFTGFSSINNSTITLGQTNTFTLTGITGADEIEVVVGGPTKSVVKTFPGNSTSVSFSSAELSGIGTGNGSITITCSAVNFQTIGGKKLKFKARYLLDMSLFIQ